ncbi:thyroid adenoma-associated protein homolog [Bufo gargarizans]|uniref:thyroid adenoma-associated protein homolog n=1 Tax=Bufo gargarizans TaxID=30331 RepID=UPI001CF4F7BE|nr:thyroid adenoma-associated protein homolog [Bufo gargarizans]
MAASRMAHAGEMEPGQCARFYQERGLHSLCSVAQALSQFAESSVKRCKDKHLDEAVQALEAAARVLKTLSGDELLPLLHYIFTTQMACSSSSSFFLKLEKVLERISQDRPNLVAQHREPFLTRLLQSKEVFQLVELHTVCMCLEGSPSGRTYFAKNLQALLSKMSLTLSSVLHGEFAQSADYCHLSVKLCLQLFRELADSIGPLVWDSSCTPNLVESILESLLQIITDQNVSRDARLLAGTAVASLANTGPVVESAALAALNLVQHFETATGALQFGELHVSHPRHTTSDVGLLAVLRGLLTCGRGDLLTCRFCSSGQTTTLLECLFPAVACLCAQQTEPYYSFQVLCLWLQRIREHLTVLLRMQGASLLTGTSETASRVMNLLWTGAEMQVDGMTALVLCCFQHYLHIHHNECQLLAIREETMLQNLLQKITEISWQARSRYTVLCALLPFLGSKKVLALYPLLPSHLFCCLETNYLCPPAAETYRTFISLQKQEWVQVGIVDEGELGKLWAEIWIAPLSDALCSTECSLQNNAATYILPCTLRTFSDSSKFLAKQLCGSGIPHLRGWISLARAQKVVSGQMVKAEERMQLCLESADDGVRLDAMSLLCCGPRTNQPPSSHELQLLKKYLPYNMGCDNPGFRQQLQAVLRRVLERLRDGAMSALRKGRTEEETVAQAIDFTDWMFHLSISSLTPAANYQRRCSALITLCSVLETFTDRWSPQRKKGQPPHDVSILLNSAKQKGCWDFLSAGSMQALLGCMQDSTNELREMASDLLARFFLPASEELTVSLFELGQAFLCSPRVPMAESGALLMKTLLQRPNECLFLAEGVPLSALGLVTYLTMMLKDHYCCAQKNLLHAASKKPIHGVLSALRLCLLDVSSFSQAILQAHDSTCWRYLLQNLVSLLQEIASFILSTLHKSWRAEPSEVAAPSFQDMGKAVGALIAHGRGLDEIQEDLLISEEHSLIMTCCWVSLKEIGMFLGPLVEKLITAPTPILSDATVEASMATYHDIFMRCRHWGAVDGCSTGFTRLCSALLHHEDQKFREMPRRMMEQALLLAKSQNSLSVTRRAAGFPVLLQGILSAEGPQHPLLETCVLSLLTLAKEPLPSNWDQTRDLPQVSAVHALQTMLRSASLRSTLLCHAVPMMSLSVHSLCSPCWAMRNAALQLFTALTVGMLGLSRSDVDCSVPSTLHAGALLRRYPGLSDVLLEELQKATKTKEILHPSLHPILTLLAKLQPGGDSEARCFMKPLLYLRENPIYAVRVMAAHALVPVVQVMDYQALIVQLIKDLPHTKDGVSHNALHGRLQQIHALLSLALKENCISEDVRQEAAKQLLPFLWLLSPVQTCFLVRNAFLEVVCLLLPSCGEDFVSQVHETLCREMSVEEHLSQVGADAFHKARVQYICNEAISSFGHSSCKLVSQLLQAGDTNVLRWLIEKQIGDVPVPFGQFLKDILQDMLCKQLTMDSSRSLRLLLEGFVHLHRICPSLAVRHLSFTKTIQCAHSLLYLLESRKGGPQVRGHVLCTLSLLLVHSDLWKDLSVATRWFSALLACADPAISCEKLRLAAAEALHIAGGDLVRQALQTTTPGLTQLAVSAILCGVDLLQDEDRGVRDLVSRFAVSSLNDTAERSLHSDWAILGLLKLLRENFWSCEETFHSLLFRLPSYDLHAALSSLHDRSMTLYEEDEPNVFADPNFLCNLLCPLIQHLLSLMAQESSLCSVVQHWVASTAIPVKEQIERWHSWVNEQGSVSLLSIRASACPRVHSAVLGLLVRSQLLLKTHEMLLENGIQIAHLKVCPGSLTKELSQLKTELELHGISGFSNIVTNVRLCRKHFLSNGDSVS